MSAICPYFRCLEFSKCSRWVTFSSAEWLKFSRECLVTHKNVCLVHSFNHNSKDMMAVSPLRTWTPPQISKAEGGDPRTGNNRNRVWVWRVSKPEEHDQQTSQTGRHGRGCWNQKVAWSPDVALLYSKTLNLPCFPPLSFFASTSYTKWKI